MKKIKNYSIITLILLFFVFCVGAKSPAPASAAQCSRAECVLEAESGRILFSHNANEKLPIASTTKILTAITAIENFDINEVTAVKKECVGIEGSSVYLREGERLTLLELLYGLMLRSGNDCAETIASNFCNRNEFIKLMNDTAKNAGATDSNFTNPHGLPDDDHYSTALDLAKITAHAMKNDTFKKIVSTKRVQISNEGFEYKRVLINKNKLLFSDPRCVGVKTGYTKKAGRCLVSAFCSGGMTVVSVVLNSPDMWQRSEEAANSAFSTYKCTTIIDADKINDSVFTSDSGKKFMLSIKDSFSYPLAAGESIDLSVKIDGVDFNEFIKNPKTCTELEVYFKNDLIFSSKAVSILK